MNVTVLGIHRGGTSTVAGVLHHLGVHMGDDLLPPSPHNPKGYFEDREFVGLHDRIIGDWRDPQVDFEPYREEYTALVRKREEQHELWGVKDPRMCFVFPYFAEIARDVHAISICRDYDLCAGSLVERGGHTPEEAIEISKRYASARKKALALVHVPVHTVRYEMLVDYPAIAVDMITHFVGLVPTQEAIDFIDPTLCHHRR